MQSVEDEKADLIRGRQAEMKAEVKILGFARSHDVNQPRRVSELAHDLKFTGITK